MANVNKIIGSLATAINKVSGSAISGLSKIIGATISLWSNTKSLSHGVVNGTDAVYAASTASDFQLIQTDAWSVSFWIKVGWTSSFNNTIHFIASNGPAGVQDNMWRIRYNETNNRLYIGWRSASNERSNNFWYFHRTGAGEAALQTGLGTTYWSSGNTGYVNANGFTLITLTKGTTITATAANVTTYWNGQNIGDAFYVNGSNNGTPAMDAAVARNFAIGNNSWTYAGQGGNGVASLYDEVALWDKELSSAEVLEIWGGAGVLGETTGAPTNLQTSSMAANLIGYWRFETDGTVSTVGSATLTLDGSSTTVTTPA